MPENITLVPLPAKCPELNPQERLWPLVDEPVANKHFATLADLEAVLAERCTRLGADTIRPHTAFHWWPNPQSSPHFMLSKVKGLPLPNAECCLPVGRAVPSHSTAFEDEMHKFRRMSQSGQMAA